MLKRQVVIGAVYTAKVSGKVVKVRIHNESMYGGWNAKNLATGRWIRIKSAAKLRERIDVGIPAPQSVAESTFGDMAK